MVPVPSSKRGRDRESGSVNSRGSAEESRPTLPPGTLHEVLVNDRRRATIDLLDGEIRLRELADRIASVEADEENPDRKVRQSVYITLHQCHLPKLDDYGVIDYDADRKRVRPADGLRAIRSYRDRVDEHATRRRADVPALPYAGLGLLGIGCLLAGAAGLAPGPSWALAAGVFLAVVVLACRAVWTARRG
jgi:hypothetical protein